VCTVALISQTNRRDFPSRPTSQEMIWEAVYLERRARDSRRYNHSYRDEAFLESGAVVPEAPSPSPEGLSGRAFGGGSGSRCNHPSGGSGRRIPADLLPTTERKYQLQEMARRLTNRKPSVTPQELD
jgi:hypothetical protein